MYLFEILICFCQVLLDLGALLVSQAGEVRPGLQGPPAGLDLGAGPGRPEQRESQDDGGTQGRPGLQGDEAAQVGDGLMNPVSCVLGEP